MALGGSTLLTPGSFNVQAVSGSTPAAWQCGLSQVIQVGTVQVGTLLDPRCVAVAFPAAWQWPTEICVAVAFPATWQWPIKRITDIFLAGASVTP